LHEAHAFLHEPAREDAVARVGGLEVLHGIARLIGTNSCMRAASS
jgi:hypothetical protein